MIRQNDFLIVKAVDEVEIYALQWTNVVDADFLADLTEDRFVGDSSFMRCPPMSPYMSALYCGSKILVCSGL